jgi:hypothetical protein
MLFDRTSVYHLLSNSMLSFRNHKTSINSNIGRWIVRKATSKKAIQQELVFLNKHPIISIFIIAILILCGCWYYNSPYNTTRYTNQKIPTRQGSVAGVNSKEEGIINGDTQALILQPYLGIRILRSSQYPDATKTPGAVYENITEKDVCEPGYSKRVRNVPVLQKRSIYKSYGISYPQPAGTFEVDHFIPLSLGGSNDDKNLWLEPATPVPGFHEKDKVEFYLYNAIYAGKISIKDAQEGIRSDWYKIYQTLAPSKVYFDPDGEST